jgi:hypothetical protein
MKFYDYTIVSGERDSRREHETDELEPAAVEVFRDMLEGHGAWFRAPIPREGFGDYELQWTADNGVAVATFYHNGIAVTISILLPGRDLEFEVSTVHGVRAAVLCVDSKTLTEADFETSSAADRPAILTFILTTAGLVREDAVMMIADMETCLAAAYFLSLD